MELREARFKRGITQYSLSKITGVHQSRISLIENGYKASEKEKGLWQKVWVLRLKMLAGLIIEIALLSCKLRKQLYRIARQLEGIHG